MCTTLRRSECVSSVSSELQTGKREAILKVKCLARQATGSGAAKKKEIYDSNLCMCVCVCGCDPIAAAAANEDDWAWKGRETRE